MPAYSLDAPRASAALRCVDSEPLCRQSVPPEQVPVTVRRAEFHGAAAIDKPSATLPQPDSATCSREAGSKIKHVSTLVAAGHVVHVHRLAAYALAIVLFLLGFTCSLPVFAVTRTLAALPLRPTSVAPKAIAACPAGKWLHAGGSCLDCSVVQTAYQEQLCPCEANRDAVIACKLGIDHRIMDCRQYDSGVAECWSRQDFPTEYNRSLTFERIEASSFALTRGLEPLISQEHVKPTTTSSLSPTSDSANSVMETPTAATTTSDITSEQDSICLLMNGGIITTEVGIAVIAMVTVCFLRRRNKIAPEVNRYAILPQKKEDCMTLNQGLLKRCTSLSEVEQEAEAAYLAPRWSAPDVALLASEIEASVTADEEVAATAQMATVQVEAEAAATAEMTTVEVEMAAPVVATAQTVVLAQAAILVEATTTYWTLSLTRQPAVT